MRRHQLGSCLTLFCALFLLAGSVLPRFTQSLPVDSTAVAHPLPVARLAQAAPATDAEALAAAWQRAQNAGSYSFVSDITQTLIPRALPEMVGQQETALTFQLDGAVQLPDSAYLEMRVAANGTDIPTLMLLRQDGQTYAQQNGKLAPTQDPTGVALPQADVLGYLGAAENVQALESVTVGDQTIARLGFDVSGAKLAERVRAHAQELLAENPDVPQGVKLAASPVLQRLSGHGELWIDAAGFPVRQLLDLSVPGLSDSYDARLHLAVDLRDYGQIEALPRAVQGADGSWTLQGALSVGGQTAAASAATTGALVGMTTSAQKDYLVNVPPSALVLFLVLVAALALIRLYRTQPKRAYTLIASVMVALMVAGPSLQAGRVVNFVERNAQAAAAEAATGDEVLQALGLAPGNVATRPAPDLDMSLDEPASQPASARSQRVAPRLQPSSGSEGEYIERCGQGSPDADTDGDGLNDQAEGCLGTDPYEADSDRDGLQDGLETTGFDYAGRHWVLNPKNTDSNGDELSDLEELSEALGGLSAVLDTDGDGVPNIWDDDNDGDGVVDNVDLSPYAASGYAQEQQLSIQGGSFDGYQYIEFQIQPQNSTHLRYTTTALDWPDDDQGNVQDLDSSTADVRLTPFMFVTTNVVPSELAREYGVRTWESDGETIMMVPMQPVTEGGNTMALYGKVAYAPDMAGRLENIEWSMQMVWMVQATLDELAGGNVLTDTTALNQFVDDFRFNGLMITRSRGYEVGVLGTPSTPVEDRNLFALRQGLALFYLGYQELEFQTPGQTALEQLEARFADPATPITYTLGVTGSLVAMVREEYGHRDAALAGMGGDLVQDFLNDNYGYDLSDTSKLCVGVDDDGDSYYFKGTSLLFAAEEEAGALDLSELTVSGPGALSANLNTVPMVTVRTVKLAMYEQLDSGVWQMMTASRMMQTAELRYRAQFDEMSVPDYENLGPDDYRFITYLGYLSANIGASAAMLEDGQVLTELVPDEEDDGALFLGFGGAANTQVGNYMPIYVSLVTSIGEALNKLKGIDWWGRLTGQKAPGFIDEFANLSPDIFTEATRPSRLALAGKVLANIGMVVGAVVGAATLVMNIMQTFCGSGEDFACGSEKAFNIANIVIQSAGAAVQAVSIAVTAIQMAMKTLDAFKGAAAAMAAVGMVVGVGMTWVTFGLAIAGSDSPVVIKAAVAIAIVTTIWLIFIFAINFIPVVGQIISAILQLIDTLISLLTGFLANDQWSVARIITEFFYSVEELTTLSDAPGPTYGNWDSNLRDQDSGLVAGNALEVTADFDGQMEKSNDGNDSDLNKSWVRGDLHAGPETQGIPVEANSSPVCTIQGDRLVCHNVPKMIFNLPTARINNKMQFEAVTTFQYVYAEYGLYGAFRWNTIEDEVQIPDEDEDPEYNDMVLDVQPASLEAWWTWNALTNPDRDGDGLTDAQETALGANAAVWDSDSDGLSDKFEYDRAADGLSVLSADSDQDGLDDRLEFRMGTKPNDVDSDKDGLWDSQEAYHRKAYSYDPCAGAIGDWVGGWQATMIGGESYWVVSNPLRAYSDVDELSDYAESVNGFSPWANNAGPALVLGVSPWASGVNARPGMFVRPNQAVSLTVELASFGAAAITTTMSLCLSSDLIGVTGGALTGDRPMNATVGACTGGTSYSWAFTGANTLQLTEQVSTTLRATTINTAVSKRGSLTVTLPYSDTMLTQAAPFVIDADNPLAVIAAPTAGALLRGGTYIVGGSASDPSSWPTRVELGIGLQGASKTYSDASGSTAWSYQWTLPADGVYELQARVHDYVGYTGLSASVPVTVDNTAPAVVISTNGTVTGEGRTIALAGTVTDNLSGVARVQISINNQPWRTVTVTGAGTTSGSWTYDWIVGTFAQGKHHLAARAWDRAGNLCAVVEKDILVDRVAPTSELTDHTYVVQPPAKQTGLALTLAGVSNDAGNVPLPSHPETLTSTMDVLDDSTVWLGPTTVDDNDLGVTLAWLGDINNDRMADLAVGLPAAAGNAGQVTVVYGRAGDWAVPPTPEMLNTSPTVLTGEAGKQLGTLLSSAGDVNGDGLADVLIGEVSSTRAYLLFGKSAYLASGELSGPSSAYVAQLDADAAITSISWASDTNGDGLDDVLVLSGGNAYLLLGRAGAWPLNLDVEDQAACVISGVLSATGLGDVDGDQLADLGATRSLAVDLYLGSDTFASEEGRALSATATLVSTDAAPVLSALGDTSGDAPVALADFVYSSGTTPQVVLGRTSGAWAVSQALAGLSGYLAGVGDVNADGKADLLARWSTGDDGSLRYGGSLGTHRATFNDVKYAPTVPYSAAADLNSDGSADMVFVPADSVATDHGYGLLGFRAAPFVAPDALQVAPDPMATGAEGEQSGASVSGARPMVATTYYVDDDGSTDACPACVSTIQSAVTSASAGDTIVVYPGVYAPFSISSKNDLTVRGVDADAVFIDGSLGATDDQDITITSSTGVTIQKMTLRSADVGVKLDTAGVGGNATPALMITLDHIVSTCPKAVSMTRTSTVKVTNSTLYAATQHIEVTGTVANGSWTDANASSPQVMDGGGLVFGRTSSTDRVWAIRGGGSKTLQRADLSAPTSWVTVTAPLGFAPGSAYATVNSGGLMMVNSNPVPGLDSDVRGMAVSGSGKLYVGLANGQIKVWNGSSWSTLSQTFTSFGAIGAGGDYVFIGNGADVWKYSETTTTFTKILHVWNYAESCFYTDPTCQYGGCSQMCHTIESTANPAVIGALVVNSGDLYVGGRFDRIQEIPIECAMEHPDTTICPLSDIDEGWYNVFKFTISTGVSTKLGGADLTNGVGGTGPADIVRALLISGGYLYIGGHFNEHYGSPSGVTSYNVIRMRLSDMLFQSLDSGTQGTDHQVYALAAQGTYILVGGSFDTVALTSATKAASNIARYDTSTSAWASPEGAISTNGIVRDIEVIGTDWYLAGDFTGFGTSNTSTAYRMAKYSASGIYLYWGEDGANGTVNALAASGSTLYAGGAFTAIGDSQSGVASRFSMRDEGSASPWWSAQYLTWLSGLETWFTFGGPSATLGSGAAMTDDGADGLYLAAGGGSTGFYYHAWAGSWAAVDSLPVAASAGTCLVRAWSAALGHMVIYAGIGGSGSIYRYDPSAAAGSRWALATSLTSGYTFGVGAAMAWDGLSNGRSRIYILSGGSSGNNSRAFFKYSTGGGMVLLGDGNTGTTTDDDYPESVGAGGGLVSYSTGGALFGLAGRAVNPGTLRKYSPVGSAIPQGKVALEDSVIVAPVGQSSFTWLTVSAQGEQEDFVTSASGTAFVGQSGITWSPTPATYTSSTTHTHAQAAFADLTRGLLRLNSGSTLTKGYYTYKGEVYVAPEYCATCTNDGYTWNTNAFASIQAAIDSGARTVRILPGTYHEAIHLVAGVALYGAGAELTVLEPTGANASAVVKGEGVVQVSLVGMSIVGDGVLEGVRLDAGVQPGLIKRVIVRGATSGIRLDGSATQVQVVNCDLVDNDKGLYASNKAWLDVRNTVLAGNTTYGVQYDNTAATVSHTYNDYWQNGTNLSPAGTGAGEKLLDPLFTDAAGLNYRPLETSPLIDAGATTDPVPAGAGGRIDIGYREYGAASFYASPAYCATCTNDGLDWQVNAFASAQDALDAAAVEVRALASALEALRSTLVTVSLSAGTFNERLTVPSYVNLVGAGATDTIINAGGDYGIKFDGVVAAQAEGLRITGATTAGVLVTNSSTAITLTRSIVNANAVGVRFDQRASGYVGFCTIVSNTGAGVVSNAAHTRAEVRNSLLSSNGQGLASTSSGLVVNDYNLLNNTTNLSGVTAGANTVYGAPQLNGYYLTSASPAVDAADPNAPVPTGGGARADLGWKELLALPIPLYLGSEHDSTITANSGVASVEVGVVKVSDATQGVAATLPTTWLAATLTTPNAGQSDWTRSYTPTEAGLHRVYARATDVVGNQETRETRWFVGAFVADSAAPLVEWVSPTGNTSTTAAAYEFQARAKDYVNDGTEDRFNVRAAWFVIDGARINATWDDTGYDPAAQTYRKFRAWLPVGSGSHTVEAWVEDGSGRQAHTGSLTLSSSGSSHAVTVTTIQTGGYTNASSLALAGYVRYASTGTGRVTVSVDSGAAVEATLADPNASSTSWTAVAALSTNGAHTITVTPIRSTTGTAATLTVTRDTTQPSLTVTEPTSGDYVTRTITFAGTASDASAGLSGVDVSLDGGYSWRAATVNAGAFSLDWIVEGAQDFSSYPARVRARDNAGNANTASVPVTVDNTPPTGLQPVTFSTPEGTYLAIDSVLGVTWNAVSDASGTAEVLVNIDQVTNTLPSTVRSGTHLDQGLNALGKWYVHIAARDAAGNITISHYGPWYVRRATGAFALQSQEILVDGFIDLDHGEWSAATQQLDDDERSGRSYTLYTVWDGTSFYLGWQGAYWGIDGELQSYMALGGTAGTLDPVHPLDQGKLPTTANVCIEITGITSGTLWTYSTTWTAQPLTFAVGPSGDTEVKVPWATMPGGTALTGSGRRLSEVTGLTLLALAVEPDGSTSSAFPTTNGTSGALTGAYGWSNVSSTTDPNVGIAQPVNVTLDATSPQVGSAAWGPDSEIEYDISIANNETSAVSGLTLALNATPGLMLWTYTGATCAAAPCLQGASSWSLAVPSVAAGATAHITVTGKLQHILALYESVTNTLTLTTPVGLVGQPVEQQVAHHVDGKVPSVVFVSPVGTVGPITQTVKGLASDGSGVGIAKVELSVNNGPWHDATGTVAWSSLAAPATGATTLLLEARATDVYGLQSPEVPLLLAVDSTVPTVTLQLDSVLGGNYAVLDGATRDPLPVGSLVTAVDVQLDSTEAAWQPATISQIPTGITQDWSWVWALPAEDNVPHTVRVRASDLVGNLGYSSWLPCKVDSIAPVVTTTHVVTQVYATGEGDMALAAMTSVLSGSVTDGSGLESIWVRIYDDWGNVYTEPVTLVGDLWDYQFQTEGAASGLYRLRVEAIDNAGNGVLYGPYELEVEEQPIAGLQAESNAPKAVNASVSLTATLTAGSNVTYTWAFGDGANGSGRTTTHSYAAAGTYTATVVARNSVSQLTDTVAVLIETPVGGASADNDGPTVLGNPTGLSASVTAGTSVQYDWAFGDGASGSGEAPSHTYAAFGSYVAVVTAHNSVSSMTATTTVDVDVPVAGVQAVNDSPTMFGAQTGLGASVTAGSRVSYTWAFGDGASGVGQSLKHVYLGTGAFTAVVTASNSVSSQSAQTAVQIICPADMLRIEPTWLVHCASWNHGFKLSYVNDAQLPIAGVTLAISVPARSMVMFDMSSPGLQTGPNNTVYWNLGTVPGSTTVTRLLMLHFYSSIPNGTHVQVNAVATTGACPPMTASVDVEIRTDGICQTPQPTFTPTLTPSVTPTVTPTVTRTPTSTATPTLTPGAGRVYLPLLRRE